MCEIISRRITLVVFRFSFNKAIVGQATCSYEYNSIREDFDNLLSIDIAIGKIPPTDNKLYEKKLEGSIMNSDDSSQALSLIKKDIFPKFEGINIETSRTEFELELQKEQSIKTRLVKFENPILEYEITNIETGKTYVITSDNEAEVIEIAYQNF